MNPSKCIAVLFAAASLATAHAATITGVSTTPAQPTAGQQVMFTVHMSGTGQCGVRLVYGGNNEPSDNVMYTSGSSTAVHKTLAKAGTYNVQAIPSPTLTPGCTGQAAMTLVVKDPAPLVSPNLAGAFASVVPYCPPAPYKEDARDTQTGKLHCHQPNPSCPAGWKQASFSDATGQLQCVAAVEPSCPAGFDGSYANGVLKCMPKPQPKVACATGALPANPWGTSYFTQNWNVLGCSVNLAPPK
jgi:hypothetical protein